MSKRVVIVGCGFAGMWSGLAAARLLDKAGADANSVEIALIAPQPALVMRPRLYEADVQNMVVQIEKLFEAVGVRYIRGTVDTVRTERNDVEFVQSDRGRSNLAYDSLVIATGSRLFRPDVPGIREHAFSIDQLDEAAELEAHCHSLVNYPDEEERNTVIVVGGGFTGIEIAAELPSRLGAILGGRTNVRVVLIEAAQGARSQLNRV
jgi:NADH dehydrogenase